MITFIGGSKFAKGGPNPLANMDSRGSISASGFGPGGPYPLADLDRGVQIQGGPNPLGHRQCQLILRTRCTFIIKTKKLFLNLRSQMFA